MDTDNRIDESRSLVISDFRNLGVSALRKSKDERTYLKINRSLKKDELGGMVIILGSNNSGKTNVLDAVEKFTKGEYDDDDLTDFITAPKAPYLTLDVAGGKYGEIVTPKIITGTANCKISGPAVDVLLYILRQRESFDLFNDWMKDSEHCDDIVYYMSGIEEQIRYSYADIEEELGKAYAHILRNREGILGESLKEIANEFEKGDITRYINDNLELSVKGTPIDDVVIVDFVKKRIGDNTYTVPVYVRKDDLDDYRASHGGIKELAKRAVKLFGRGRKYYDPLGDVTITDLSGGVKETEVIPDAFSDVYGYNLSRKVYKYRQRPIKNSDLESGIDDLNEFITRVFSILGYDNKSIINRYYEIASNRDNLEDKLNRELESISEDLNRLLNSGSRKYGLHIRLEKAAVRLSISCGDNKSLNLDHQSEGFRWLFGFFINFLMSKKFVAGDMVIIDEFGGLLNFGTVKELTDILRDFARKHGITFIIATQNPMVVDISHLSEVRMVVPRKDGGADIFNDFTEFGSGECTDVLRPIVSSMTVGRNFLRKDESATIFVESYRDYFYLTAFNVMMGYHIDFIPVNGITEFTSPESFASSLKSIERNPVLLADESIHDGAVLDELRKNGVQIYTVSEITEGKGLVTDLFSPEDTVRLSPADASFDRASCMSYAIPEDEDMSDETKENFRKVLDYISLG